MKDTIDDKNASEYVRKIYAEGTIDLKMTLLKKEKDLRKKYYECRDTRECVTQERRKAEKIVQDCIARYEELRNESYDILAELEIIGKELNSRYDSD